MLPTTPLTLLLSLSTITLATPLFKRQDPGWSFTSYASLDRCTGKQESVQDVHVSHIHRLTLSTTSGAAGSYSGDQSAPCTSGADITTGGSFGSFIPGNIREGCSVRFYTLSDCAPDTLIRTLTNGAPAVCEQANPPQNIQAFDVRCS
jgi:hypothetical protein